MTNLESSSAEKASKALARSTFGASVGVMLSRLSGLFRSQIVTAVFGAGIALDAFNLALRFPNALRDLFADGALSSAFTKSLVTARAEGPEAERKLISVVTAVFGLITFGLALLGFLFAKEFIDITSRPLSGSSSASLFASLRGSFTTGGGIELAGFLFKFMVFYLPISMMSAAAMAALSVRRQTFRATIASAFFNVGTICGAILFAPIFKWVNLPPVTGLACGALLGGALQFTYQVRPLIKEGIWAWPSLSWHDLRSFKPLHEVITLMIPRALAQGAMILALLINTQYAIDAGVGAMTYIANATTIILVPVGLFGVAAGFSSLPHLTEYANQNDGATWSRLVDDSLQSTLWLALFSMTCFALLATPFCIVLFGHGRFTVEDCFQTGVAVAAYGVGIPFNSGSKVLQQGFFSLNRTRQVVINSCVYLAINATLSALLAPRFGIVGLGFSNSLSAAADFFLNVYFLRKISYQHNTSFKVFASGSKTAPKILIILGIGTVALGLTGVWINGFVWKEIAQQIGIRPGFISALGALGLVGGLLAAAFATLITRYGPFPLRSTAERLLTRIVKILRRT